VAAGPVLAVLAAAAALAVGCGGITPPDLFIVKRSGTGPHARLTMLINEEGGIRCNGGPELKLSDPQLVKARAIQEELEKPSSHHLALAAQPGSVLSYSVRDENGTVSFADNSRGQPKVLRALVLLVLEASQQVCHLPE
jgi:hypothetical protein